MSKPVLSLVLALTQLLPWSASPLFLCLGSDGSVCLDAGPDACSCCHRHEDEPDCGGLACSEMHDQCETSDVPGLCANDSGDDCDCTHVQLSQGQRAFRRGGSRSGSQPAPALKSLAPVDGAPVTVARQWASLTARLRPAGSSALPPSERAPFVLRC